jgi:hypothetical protein
MPFNILEDENDWSCVCQLVKLLLPLKEVTLLVYQGEALTISTSFRYSIILKQLFE